MGTVPRTISDDFTHCFNYAYCTHLHSWEINQCTSRSPPCTVYFQLHVHVPTLPPPSQVLGAIDEFDIALRQVIRDITFDTDLVVSVFETNIRVLGGLLGGHFAAMALKEKGHHQLNWYNGQLLRMAEEVGTRLLPAFNTSTGLPYPKVNALV